MAARFITLEGIEGAGKSTVARFLGEWLQARGVRVLMTREPGGTSLAERVRAIVLERGGELLTPVTETLLMFAARGIHLENLIRPALARGEWVVCDRFTDATRAYQAGVEVGLARSKARSGNVPTDRFEAEPAVFFERVRAAYLDLARREPQRITVIDAAASLSAVQAAIASVLTHLMAMDS